MKQNGVAKSREVSPEETTTATFDLSHANPSGDQTVAKFLDDFLHARYGQCLRMLNDGKVLVLTPASLESLTSQIDHFRGGIGDYSQALEEVRAERDKLLDAMREFTVFALPILHYVTQVKQNPELRAKAIQAAYKQPIPGLGMEIGTFIKAVGVVVPSLKKAVKENEEHMALLVTMMKFFATNQDKLSQRMASVGGSLKAAIDDVVLKHIPEIREFMERQNALLSSPDKTTNEA